MRPHHPQPQEKPATQSRASFFLRRFFTQVKALARPVCKAPLDGPLDLVLGATTTVRVEPSSNGVTVEVAGTTSLLALGDSLLLGAATLRYLRDGEPTGYRLVATHGTKLALAPNAFLRSLTGACQVGACDLARGDCITLGDGSVLEVPAD